MIGVKPDSVIGKLLASRNKDKKPETKHEHLMKIEGHYEKLVCEVCGDVYYRKIEVEKA